MKQAELVRVLRAHAESRPSMLGQAIFASFLARYIEELIIPADQKYVFWQIDDRIPMIIVGAIRVFEKSEDRWVIELRNSYEKETRHSFRDPTRVHPASNTEDELDIEMIKDLMRGTMGWMGKQLSTNIDALLYAERHVIGLRFAQFQDRVYNAGGLSKIIAASKSRGMSGQFGATTLRTCTIAGRLMFTFARQNGAKEQSVSFDIAESDLIGLGGRLQSYYAELHEALTMIEDVISNWPTDKATFKDNETAMIG